MSAREVKTMDDVLNFIDTSSNETESDEDSHVVRLISEKAVTDDERKELGSKKKKRPRIECPDWLVMNSVNYHSEKQLSSGVDLTNTKKRYKLMYCTYCRVYNPRSAWATEKLRKIERETLNEHERSINHIRAVRRRTEEVTDVSQLSEIELPLSSSSRGCTSQDLMYLNTAVVPREATSLPTVASQENDNCSVISTKSRMPSWLRSSGKLVFSEAQIASGKNLTGNIKKKYKAVSCMICEIYNPYSPWAITKLRKFEVKVLHDHEKSLPHKQAVAVKEKDDLAANRITYCQSTSDPNSRIGQVKKIKHESDMINYSLYQSENHNFITDETNHFSPTLHTFSWNQVMPDHYGNFPSRFTNLNSGNDHSLFLYPNSGAPFISPSVPLHQQPWSILPYSAGIPSSTSYSEYAESDEKTDSNFGGIQR